MILSDEDWVALAISLKVAVVASAASLPFGIAVAWLLARKSFPGKSVLNGLVHLPLILPPVVTGYILLILFGRKGVIGSVLDQVFGIVLSFRWTGAALAAAVMGFPLMVRAIRLSIESLDRGLESAASTLGASRFDVFRTVTLPLIMPGIITGTILAFAKAMGEFGATITFVSAIPGETKTLAAAIYGYTQVPGGDEGAMRLTLISVVVSLAALLASECWPPGAGPHGGPRCLKSISVTARGFPNRVSLHDRRRPHRTGRPLRLGKTTLANIAAGLTRPEAGHITFSGETWFDRERNIFLPLTAAASAMCFRKGALPAYDRAAEPALCPPLPPDKDR